MSLTLGTTFSIPMLAICSGGTAAPMSAFPSLVQTMKVPVSAIARLPPFMPLRRKEIADARCSLAVACGIIAASIAHFLYA